MNKSVIAISLLIFASPVIASDSDYRYQLHQTDSYRQNRDRVEATRRIGQDSDSTRYIIDNSGRPAGYSIQDRSGQIHLYNNAGQWTGHTDR